MILGILILNKQFQIRLKKIYDESLSDIIESDMQAQIMKQLQDRLLAKWKFQYDSQSNTNQNMQLKAHQAEIGSVTSASNIIGDIEALEQIGAQIVYREFASLIFVFILEKQSESELAVLDLIQFVVEVLDRQFGNNVCEVDLVFNPDKLHFIMDEIIIDGIVISTDVEETCAELESRRKAIEAEE